MALMTKAAVVVTLAFVGSPGGLAATFGNAQLRNPGAGMTPAAITPFKDYHMDGFSVVTCAADMMLVHGDKHGDGKFSYKLGDVSNVSILHYTEMVPKTEQKQMTHGVCFSFCRTVPMMSFFGITNGRDCYCTPYFKQVADDSSQCDSVCDGDPTTMCGGKTKSSIFEMHSCNDAAAKLQEASASAGAAGVALTAAAKEVGDASKAMQDGATALQAAFGKVGDGAATGLLQDAKKFAGELEHAAEAGTTLVAKLAALPTAAGPSDLATEKVTAELTSTAETANTSTAELGELAKEALAPKGTGKEKLYYPLMYFVDKDFADMPSTCGGDAVAKPLVGSYDGCASACEAAEGLSCKAFSFYESSTGGLCFLLSKVTTATYYTGCTASTSAFLQQRAAADTKCVLKFSAYEGTSIKPDGSGKCEGCLKEVTKADRCFE